MRHVSGRPKTGSLKRACTSTLLATYFQHVPTGSVPMPECAMSCNSSRHGVLNAAGGSCSSWPGP